MEQFTSDSEANCQKVLLLTIINIMVVSKPQQAKYDRHIFMLVLQLSCTLSLL